MSARRRPTGDDEGSILPLVIGYAMLALVAILVCAAATSLYLEQKRLDGLADAAALAGADGFVLTVVAGVPRAELTDQKVREQAEALVAAAAPDVVVTAASSPDGRSAQVTLAGYWRPPLLTPFVPKGVPLEATGTSRTALR